MLFRAHPVWNAKVLVSQKYWKAWTKKGTLFKLSNQHYSSVNKVVLNKQFVSPAIFRDNLVKIPLLRSWNKRQRSFITMFESIGKFLFLLIQVLIFRKLVHLLKFWFMKAKRVQTYVILQLFYFCTLQIKSKWKKNWNLFQNFF